MIGPCWWWARGAVGTRRATALAEAGARVTVVAPEVDEALTGVEIEQREYRESDLDGVWLVVACTSDPAVNASVAAAAHERRVFCVRADDATGGTARVPVVARRDDLTVAVNGGDDPRRAVALRDAIATALDLGELPVARHRPAAAGSVALVGGGPGRSRADHRSWAPSRRDGRRRGRRPARAARAARRPRRRTSR